MTRRSTRTSKHSAVLPILASRCIAGVAAGLPLAAAAAPTGLEEIVVTATRRATPRLETPLSLDAVDRESLQLLGSTHHSEALNRLPGVMIQRGSGQESLTAIRSPVLAGAGSCVAFLFMENGVPIRHVGFCNVNELLEVDTEQAQAIEVLRGPGTALYGSSAMHGVVNVLQAEPQGQPARSFGVDAGPQRNRDRADRLVVHDPATDRRNPTVGHGAFVQRQFEGRFGTMADRPDHGA